LHLEVQDIEGRALISCGGVQILDYSAELGKNGLTIGPDWITIEVLGISYPLYEEIFPQHVADYKNRWEEKFKVTKDNEVAS
jgi:hypothetical protein